MTASSAACGALLPGPSQIFPPRDPIPFLERSACYGDLVRAVLVNHHRA